jgi:prepilin-type N-terminal cleavage/methylation domain-containing protein
MKNINKNAFTLVEMLISITLFTIITLFLYQTLDLTKKSNDFYESKLNIKLDENNLKKLLFLDFINKIKPEIEISLHKNHNNIIQLQSANTYHNPFYIYITYFLSREKNLVRIESKTKFNPKKINENFFESAYIDIIYRNVDKIEAKKIDNEILLYINTNKDKKILMRL